LGRGGIKTIPPGFERGLDFDSTAAENDLLDSEEHHRVEPIYRPLVSNLPETNGVRIFRPVSILTGLTDQIIQRGRGARKEGLDPEVESLLPRDVCVVYLIDTTGEDQLTPDLLQRLQLPVSAPVKRRPGVSKKDWAHVVDVNNELVNFRELVPDMAREVGSMRTPLYTQSC
jgi:antiviral helicase SKI2